LKEYIRCPVCGKKLGEWIKIEGRAVIKKLCPKCKKHRYITRES